MSTPSNPRRLSLVALTSALALGSFCAEAAAQRSLGNGRILDRNPRVGSGGFNSPRARTAGDIARYNNAIITGNAGYGKSFQGYVGYLAPDDFRASLGSNDLYSFRRDSSSGNQVAQGIRGTDALRYQFSLATGQAPPSNLSAAASGASFIAARSGSAGITYTNPTGSALRSTSDYLGQRSLRANVVGYRTGEDGLNYAVTASPLMGISQVPMNLPRSMPLPAAPQMVPQVPSGSVPLPGTGGSTGRQEVNDPAKAAIKANRYAGNTLSGVESARPGVPNPFAAQQVVDNSLASSRYSTRVEAPLVIVDQFKRALPPERLNGPAADPNDPAATTDGAPAKAFWEVELDRLRDRLKNGGEADPAAPGRNPSGVAPDANADDDNEDPDADESKSSGPLSMDDIRSMVRPDLDKIDRDVRRAIAGARPFIDRLATAAPTDNAAYSGHLTAAEDLLNEGRYFDAEDRFLRAIAAKPGDPLASVGRAHAQLGAGLYLSAGMNLHTLFQEHPEMMGTRYSRSLLPSMQRATVIAAQMRQNIGSTRTLLGRDAALLLAYLGYQLGDRAMLEEGIKAFAERTESRDKSERTLLALMQQIWVDGVDSRSPAPVAPATEK